MRDNTIKPTMPKVNSDVSRYLQKAAIGIIVGAVVGFLFAGPAGAAVGAKLGATGGASS